ncbi:hypothetical protein RFI_32688 [Reticulomyxa filosa]|uniref:Uncharacterized protein n=1 Tax=Reticulomyxa filosa TaxID=46433 RepID=X6LS28_RETFI|nr:hypothetical protein RFI_32688 [Reticulomyxa filosa]|eukprot:ETO04708.1 hypothetical protein RFI_32688 [Reticulomyxa filosa]
MEKSSTTYVFVRIVDQYLPKLICKSSTSQDMIQEEKKKEDNDIIFPLDKILGLENLLAEGFEPEFEYDKIIKSMTSSIKVKIIDENKEDEQWQNTNIDQSLQNETVILKLYEVLKELSKKNKWSLMPALMFVLLKILLFNENHHYHCPKKEILEDIINLAIGCQQERHLWFEDIETGLNVFKSINK